MTGSIVLNNFNRRSELECVPQLSSNTESHHAVPHAGKERKKVPLACSQGKTSQHGQKNKTNKNHSFKTVTTWDLKTTEAAQNQRLAFLHWSLWGTRHTNPTLQITFNFSSHRTTVTVYHNIQYIKKAFCSSHYNTPNQYESLNARVHCSPMLEPTSHPCALEPVGHKKQ